MKTALAILFTIVPCLAGTQDQPPVAGQPPKDLILVEKCSLEYERSTTVGAFVLIQAGGRIQDSYVRQGDRVKAGQVLGRLHDRDARAELARLIHEIEDNIEIPLAETKLAQNRVNVTRSRTLFAKNMYNKAQLEAEELETRSLELELAQAKHDLRQNELLRIRTEAEVSSREMVAPHDGIVVDVLKRVGESTAVNEAVYRILDLDRLKVTGQVDVKDAWRVRVGQAVCISPDIASVDLPIEREVFTGFVTYVDPQIDPETRTCKVVAEVANRDGMLRSGLEARMEVLFESSTSPAAGRSAASKPDTTPIGPARPQVATPAPDLPSTGQESSKNFSSPDVKSGPMVRMREASEGRLRDPIAPDPR